MRGDRRAPRAAAQAIVLREIYGVSYAEAAVALGVSLAALKSLLFRARSELQQQLEPARLKLGALVVPSSLREALADATPGFSAATASSGAVAGPVAAIVAKLAAAPVAAQVATATVAATVVTATAAVAPPAIAALRGDVAAKVRAGAIEAKRALPPRSEQPAAHSRSGGPSDLHSSAGRPRPRAGASSGRKRPLVQAAARWSSKT